MTDEDIQIKERPPLPYLPRTRGEYEALQRAMDRYKEEQHQKELREWLIYEAPNGFREAFMQEMEEIAKNREKRLKLELKAAWLFALCLAFYLGWVIVDLWKVVMA